MVEERRMANIVYCLTNDMLFERSKSENSSCSKVKSLLVGCISQQVSFRAQEHSYSEKVSMIIKWTPSIALESSAVEQLCLKFVTHARYV